MIVGAWRFRKWVLRWDLGARLPASWLAMRTPSLAVDGAQARGSIAIVKAFTGDELGWYSHGRERTRVQYTRHLNNMRQ